MKWRQAMRRVYHTAVLALAAPAFGASACQSGTALNEIQNKQLSVSVVGTSPAELTATLNTSNSPPYPCGLEDDAFARLNGQSVPLFRGAEYTVSTVDDGEVGCHEPSVTVSPIPSGLSPPWTLEIGDSSEIVSATFGPEAYQVGPILNVVAHELGRHVDRSDLRGRPDGGGGHQGHLDGVRRSVRIADRHDRRLRH